jgi:hypothetical protein
MQKALRILTLCTLVLCSSAAHAFTGYELVQKCTSENDKEQALCAAYITGAQTQLLLEHIKPGYINTCPPMYLEQTTALFIRYANDHPEEIGDENFNWAAGSIFRDMFLKNYGPCLNSQR